MQPMSSDTYANTLKGMRQVATKMENFCRVEWLQKWLKVQSPRDHPMTAYKTIKYLTYVDRHYISCPQRVNYKHFRLLANGFLREK